MIGIGDRAFTPNPQSLIPSVERQYDMPMPIDAITWLPSGVPSFTLNDFVPSPRAR